jgi:hypothetical protein
MAVVRRRILTRASLLGVPCFPLPLGASQLPRTSSRVQPRRELSAQPCLAPPSARPCRAVELTARIRRRFPLPGGRARPSRSAVASSKFY